MTNEEAIKELQSMCDHLHAHGICDKDSNMLTACKMAISALEQQPCERFEWGIDGKVYKITKAKDGKEICQQVCDDAISRNMALEKMADYVASGYADSAEDFEEYSRIICQLPSITQKSGKWIDDGWYADGHSHKVFHCSECGHNVLGFKEDLSKFCPNCGAKMVEPQESEDKK